MLLCVPALLLAGLFAGCSGLQASSSMTSTIEVAATTAKTALATTQPADALAVNASYATTISKGKTTNWFAYVVGSGDPYTAAQIYEDLTAHKVAMAELAKRASVLTPARQTLALEIEQQLAEIVRLEREGLAATSSLATVAGIQARAKALSPARKGTSAELQALIDALPDELKTWGAAYGPSLLSLGVTEADALIALAIAGDIETPMIAAMEVMTDDELLTNAASILTTSRETCNANAESVSTQKTSLWSLVSVALSAVGSLFGF